ncbi:ABC transporter ATP-binding protein [Mycoplasma putrefaciens]|uniref:ABC transporter, ATP-binding component n=1 Tax=Mycoplasma putrefaciens Mput9231 TaxID=1292033 RepID=M9WCV8_9MOLU|nr:ABC transporter ATP-binding protein [Mycoplasma putrefaciens]AGJ90962.1 ABC transporter, ATP-binding component [Mycoplasma putrefaciens Mput9231]
MKQQENEIISITNLTKKYKSGYGIFDINLKVKKGEIYGYLGPNGAGKSTTIRHMMGYIKPEKGTTKILQKDAWKESHFIQPRIGYVPGEINLPEYMNGLDFIKQIFSLRKQTNWDYVEKLIKYFEFDPNIKIKKMSKGMKQKVALVIAFMHKPELLILDEPTSGLDPLMQNKFINLVLEHKKLNTTIIMSSHIFDEIEKTCNKVAIIRSGRIIADIDLENLRQISDRNYQITFSDNKILKSKFLKSFNNNQALYVVSADQVANFFESLKKYDIKMLKEIPFSLEKYFLNFYNQKGENKNV